MHDKIFIKLNGLSANSSAPRYQFKMFALYSKTTNYYGAHIDNRGRADYRQFIEELQKYRIEEDTIATIKEGDWLITEGCSSLTALRVIKKTDKQVTVSEPVYEQGLVQSERQVILRIIQDDWSEPVFCLANKKHFIRCYYAVPADVFSQLVNLSD